MPALDNGRCAAMFYALTSMDMACALPSGQGGASVFEAQVSDARIAAEGLSCLSLATTGLARAASLQGKRGEAASAAEAEHRCSVSQLRENLNLQARLKRELLALLPVEDAAAVLAGGMETEHAPHLGNARLSMMRDYLRARSISYAEIDAPKCFTIAHPKIFGSVEQGETPALGRTPFVGAVADAVVRHRSSLVRIGDDLLLDAQEDELDEIPVDLRVDPNVLDVRAKEIVTFEFAGAPIGDLAEAVHLGGVPSHAFGHWIAQFLPKYFAARASGLLPPVPILIDADMHATHRQALEYFLADHVEIVEVPIMASVRVSRLWLLGDWVYVPLCPRPGQDLGPRRLSSPPQETARIVRCMLAGAGLSAGDAAGRLFLARRAHLHRRMLNHARIEEIARDRGFTVVYLEDHPFDQQIALIRASKYIVGPDGSALIMCMFANCGTKVTMLSHGFIENNASLVAILDALDLDVVMLQGRCVQEHADYRRFSDYEIDETDFDAILSR